MPELSFSDFWRDANLGRLKEVGGMRSGRWQPVAMFL